MRKFRATEHIPRFVDTDREPEEYGYDTTEELLEVEWVKSYAECDEFNNFCQSKDGRILMIEDKDGTWWWVVAHVTKNSLNLPVARMVK